MFDAEKRWYALRTRARHEKQVRDRLRAIAAVEPLLPTVVRLSRWKDRRKMIEVPLFPGYCFAWFAQPSGRAVRCTPGVVQIVGNGGRPEPIPEEEIAAIRALMASKLPYDAHPYLKEGMPVRVVRGPLEGMQGILLRKQRAYRLVIAVHLVQQAASVEIDASDVAPL